MQSVLVMFRSNGDRRSFSVTRDVTVIGRREDCDLIIPLGEVSRKHCRLVRDGDLLKLEDLGSANGTYLNGQRVQESLLAPGDTVQLGPVVFVLQIDGVPADEELQPVYAQGAAAAGDAAGGEGAEALDDVDVHPGGHAAVDDLAAEGSPDALESLEDITPVGDDEDDASRPAARRSAAPHRVPPPVPAEDHAGPGDDPIPLDDLEPQSDLQHLVAADDAAGANGEVHDELADLDLLEIEPEAGEQRRA